MLLLDLLPKKNLLQKTERFVWIACYSYSITVGLILYFVSPLGFNSLGNMKDAAIRLTSLEHPLINIIAIALITIGWSRHKKQLQAKPSLKPSHCSTE